MPFDLAHELAKRPTEDPMRWPTLPWIFWALSSSLMLHGVAYASLGFAKPRVSAARASSEVVFEVAPLPPAPPPAPEPEPELKPEPEPAPTLTRSPAPARTPEPAPAPEPQLEPAKPAAPLDLAGVTLTNAGDDGFAMRAGNGLAFAGPIGPGSARAPLVASPRASDPPKRAEPALPDFVPVSDLSARPVPPALAGALRRNYPDEARRRAIGGTARVRARLDADGVARHVQIENESFPGFGEACRRTLAGSSWSAPRDRNGRAVTTEIRYTCRFEVEP
jgi:TonB family protein